jgi:hypothetical protein
LLNRIEARREALEKLVYELDCCLQGLVRPVDGVERADSEGGSEGVASVASDASEPRRRSRALSSGAGLRLAGDDSVPGEHSSSTVNSMHRSSTNKGSREVNEVQLSVSQAAHPHFRMEGSRLSLEALGREVGIAGHDKVCGAGGALPQRTVTCVDGIADLDNLDIACSAEDDQLIGSAIDNAGNENLKDENVDDAKSEDDLLPSANAKPSVRVRTQSFTLCSRGWRAPYAAQLHVYQAGANRGPSPDE